MTELEEIIALFPAPELRKADCANCKYDDLPHDGGHCYMFAQKPGEYCAQFEPKRKK